MSDLQLCALLLIKLSSSSEEELRKQDESIISESFVAKVLLKKIEVFKIPVIVPTPVLLLIDLCTQGNPGYAQVMLKELLGKDREFNSIITSQDFVKVYANEFPLISLPGKKEYFSKLWDGQKVEGNNLCDTPEWWMESFCETTKS